MSQWIVTPDKFLTDEESKKLRRMCEEAAIIAKSKGNQMAVRNRLIIEMALGTGLRVSELANLKIDDIHIRKGQNSLIVNNGKGDRKPQSGRWYRARHLADLPSTKQTAMEALERTQAQLGQEKVESAVMPMVVENSNAARLLYRLFQPLSGASIQQKNSFLDGKKEQQIASKALTITDNPIIVRGLGSRLYDGDGIAAKEMPVIQDGVLKNYYIDVYYGRKLGWAPTTGYASNIIIQPGKRSAKTIEKNLDRGILVTNWLGGNANGTTGDFSLGVAGWLIENGQRTQPIGEMNISGNYSDLLMNLKEVGNDPYPYSSFRTPTLLFNDVSFSGT